MYRKSLGTETGSTMFANRIRRFALVGQELRTGTAAFVMMGVVPASGMGAIYHTAYLTAFKTVQKRVVRRRQLQAARRVSWN